MKKRLISMAMALLLIAGLPVSAFADWDIAKGNITVEAVDGVQNVSQSGGESKQDAAPVITGTSEQYTVTITAAEGQTANVTLSNVNITATDEAPISTSGDGNVSFELDGKNSLTATGSNYNAGLEKGNRGDMIINDKDGNGSLTAQGAEYGAGIGSKGGADVSGIIINSGDIDATGGFGGAGIGSGAYGNSDGTTINGGDVKAQGGTNAAGIGSGAYGDSDGTMINGGEVEATGGESAAGIGSGLKGKCSSVVISGDSEVKAQGGAWGTAIGSGAVSGATSGTAVSPDTSKLTKNGKVMLYAPGVDMKTAEPMYTKIGTYVPPVAAKAAEQTVKLYNVVDKDGKDISYKTEVKDGVLTVTVDGDYAVLTGAVSGISVLTAQGITTVVFVTSGATSTFDLADLSAKGSGTYKLTHDGATVTFTLGTTDISEILK